MNETIAATKVRKPRVLGLVLVLLLRSVLIYIAYTTIQEISQSPELYEGWALPLYYLLFAMGIAMLIGSILIAIYRRLGLFIGAGTSILDFILALPAFVAGSQISWVGLAISAYIVYYTLKYLRHEPEKSFFH